MLPVRGRLLGTVEKKVMDASSPKKMLLVATYGLKTSIEYTLRQLKPRKVRTETKAKLMRSFTSQAETLAKVAQALHSIKDKSEAAWDLSTFLSKVESDILSGFATARVARIACTMHRCATRWERNLTVRRRH